MKGIGFGDATRITGGDTSCPMCGSLLDGSTGVGELADADDPAEQQRVARMVPHAGAVTVCAYCGQLLQFGQALEMVPVADSDVRPHVPAGVWLVLGAVRKLALERKVINPGGRGDQPWPVWLRAVRRRGFG